MMKAREDDRRIFSSDVTPRVLAIQESKGLDAEKVTEALNAPILKTDLPPSKYLFDELEEERAPLFSKKNLAVNGDIAQADMADLIDLFEHGKTFGSLIRVPKKLAEKLPAIAQGVADVLAHGAMFEQSMANWLRPLIEQGCMLASQYGVVVANPPYLGGKGMSATLKSFAKKEYRTSSSDTFAMFVERLQEMSKQNGHIGLVMPYVWMFLSSYEDFRKFLQLHMSITSLIQLEYNAFEPACVPVCTLTSINTPMGKYRGDFIKLSDFKGHQNQALKTLEAIHDPDCGWRFKACSDDFKKIPGSPIAYWISERMRQCFQDGTPLGEIAEPRQGMATADNNRFLRRWHEVSHTRIGFRYPNREAARESRLKWFPYNKGGEFRRWFGNSEWLVNWEDDGKEIQNFTDDTGYLRSRPQSLDCMFRPALTWTDISSSFFAVRCSDSGFLFDVSGSSAFPPDDWRVCIAGFLASKVASSMLAVLNPTMHFQVGNIKTLPVLQPQLLARKSVIDAVVREAVQLARTDWDSFETSWDFQALPVLQQRATTLSQSQAAADAEVLTRFQCMKQLEEENNRLFINAYGLQDELFPAVSENQITLYRPNRGEDTRRLISYAIGCMMGRYSLDKPGLIYAHSGNHRFWDVYHEKHDRHEKDKTGAFSDNSCFLWSTFPPDNDGIIPITDDDWFPDDAANRVEAFIATAWPKEHLEENLKFIAESLGPNRNEQPRETVRRYLATGFFKHHLSIYKRRPIYWLFSSGKQRAFQCLVYLHRYNEGTLSRMRTEYVIPLQGKIASRIGQLDDDINAATSTSHRKRLEKERDKLLKQQVELQTFDEKLRHYADRRIRIDLDDGVKVNYAKFGDLLAEVKAVTGSTQET